MKRLSILGFLSIFVAAPAMGQSFYIPGMPVPDSGSGSSAATSDSSSGSGGGSAQGNNRIARVSVASGEFMANDAVSVQPVDVSTMNKAEYKGVTPPERLVPENSKTFAKTSANQLSWIGFVPEKDGHKVFLQTTQATTYERVATSGKRVELIIENTKLAVPNNNRELDMKYFNSPFLRAKAVRAGKNVRVIVDLKEEGNCDIVQHDNMIDIVAKK